MDVRFLETAKAEFWEAAAYYEHEQEGLGGEFAREVSKTLDRIVDHPHAWRPLSPRTRQCRTHLFPYAVIYQVRSDYVLVVAIMHLYVLDQLPDDGGRIPDNVRRKLRRLHDA